MLWWCVLNWDVGKKNILPCGGLRFGGLSGGWAAGWYRRVSAETTSEPDGTTRHYVAWGWSPDLNPSRHKYHETGRRPPSAPSTPNEIDCAISSSWTSRNGRQTNIYAYDERVSGGSASKSVGDGNGTGWDMMHVIPRDFLFRFSVSRAWISRGDRSKSICTRRTVRNGNNAR